MLCQARLGQWKVGIYGEGEGAAAVVQQWASRFPAFVEQTPSVEQRDTYVIVARGLPERAAFLDWLPEEHHVLWEQFHASLTVGYQEDYLPLLSDSEPSRELQQIRYTFGWPSYMLTQGYMLEGEWQGRFFAILLGRQPDERTCELLNYNLVFLASVHHIKREGLCVHSSAMAYEGKGAVFLGESGAGKTTVTKLLASMDHTVFGDDLNFIVRYHHEEYGLAATPSLDVVTRFPQVQAPLWRIFVLKQDTREYLVPLSPMQVAVKIVESVLQAPKTSSFTGNVVEAAFRNACAIARRIPGYELHFRKSLDFLKVIDE